MWMKTAYVLTVPLPYGLNALSVQAVWQMVPHQTGKVVNTLNCSNMTGNQLPYLLECKMRFFTWNLVLKYVRSF